MKKSRLRGQRARIALRLSVVLCLCLILALLPRSPMKATAAGTEGMITIELSDSYGDGWSDNAIDIYADGEWIGTATMDDGASATWTAPIDPHVAYEFRWVNGIYAQETSFVIYIGTEQKISASGYDYAGGAVILSVAQSCDGPNYQGGVCADCGASCIHLYVGEDGTCADCGHACAGHVWVNGVCSVCSGTCLHQSYKDGACNVCGAKMILAIEMADIYSDGWTNNAIKIYADGVLLDTATVHIGFNGVWTTEYDSNAVYTFEWVQGNYADECSFRILLMGQPCYEATTDDCAMLEPGVFFTLRPWCGHESFDDNFCCTSCGQPCAHPGIQPKGTCSDCGFTCGTSAPHKWENNTCTVCGLTCEHSSWTNSVCNNCGFACGSDEDHSFNANHTCTKCGFACGTTAPHAWDQDTCTVCGLTCAHSSWSDGVCNGCGLACGTDAPHRFDANHVCTLCGFACGSTAPHDWDRGTCAVCGLTCAHAKYVNGLCGVCGHYQSAVQNGVGANGFALYEIHNAGQLLWFADYVNSNQVLSTVTVQGTAADDAFFFEYTSGCVNGKLMADIDMSGLAWVPIGTPHLSHSASRNSYGYAGVFDGNGHTVSGVNCNVVAADNTVYAGFFGAVGGGTIKNLTVKGNIQGVVNTDYYPSVYAGGIAGYACEWFDYPSLSAQDRQSVSSQIINCTFIGNVSAKAADQEYAGGIVGMASGTAITNCLSAAMVSASNVGYTCVGSLCGSLINDCTITNCWYDLTLCNLGEVEGQDHPGVTGMSSQHLALGHAALALGFGQTLGVDAYPSYGDDPVYQITTGCCTYSNTPVGTVIQKAHAGGIGCFQQPVCADCAMPYGEFTGHIPAADDGDCTTDICCAACGQVMTPGNAQHTWLNATCTAPKTCSVCGTTEGSALGHNHVGKVTTAATCTADGVETFTCSRCSDSYTKPIAKLGHSYTSKVTAPTCEAQGYTTHTCSRCSDSYKDTYKAALGHAYSYAVTKEPTTSATGTLKGTCSRCSGTTTVTLPKLTTTDYTYSVTKEATCTATGTGKYTWKTTTYGSFSFNVTIAAKGHNYSTKVTAPTCTAQGYTTHTCGNCGDTYKDTYKDALGHSYSSKVTKEATCTAAGVKTFTCSKCSHSYTEAIAKLGHDYKSVVTAPTCTAEGYTTHTCSRCSDSYKDAYKAANGHSYTGGKCSVCGDTKVVSVNGTFNDWAGSNMTWTANGYTFNIVLPAGNYQFKLIKDGVWLGNNGEIMDTTTATSNIGWEFADWADDCDLIATGGTYTFTFNFDTNMLVIEYVHTHVYNAGEVVAPTCTAKGYTVYTCACGDTENRDEVAALGHNHVGKVTTAATCTADGVETFTCSRCSDSYTKPIAKLGHDYKAVVTAPTCTAKGYTTHTCSRCSDSYKDSYVDALGHNYQNGSCTNCGDSCVHSYTSKVTKEPTCTADGVKTFTCSICGGTYTEAIDKLGHSYSSKVTAPTCTAEGYTTHTCGTCGYSYKDNYKSALGHSYSSKVTTAATCTTDGVKTFTCGTCGHSYTEVIPAIGHNYVGGKCGNCGDTRPVQIAGSFNSWTVQNLTYSSSGYTFTVTLSAGTYQFKLIKDGVWLGNNGEIMDTTTATSSIGWEFADWADDCDLIATGGTYTFTFHFDTNMLVIEYVHTHVYNAGEVVAPTCTAKGYTVYTCACGDSENRDEVAALGHNHVGKITTAATCTADGVETFTCSRCSDSYTKPIAKLGHDYKAVVTAPTCTAKGYTTHTCSRCSDSYKDSYVDALGHNYQNGSCTNCGDSCVHSYTSKVTKEPTCTADGVKTFTCSICGGTYTEAIDKLGHSYKAVVTAPTCTAEGYTTYTCSTCGDSYVSDKVAALGHSYSEKVTDATCTTDGTRVYTCGTCGHSYTEVIEALGHDYKATVTAPTCTDGGYTTYTCSTCGDSYVSDKVAALGHSYSEKVTNATCTTDGTRVYTCGTCGHRYTEVIEALGHDYKAVVTAPTCTAEGYTTHTCANCGDSYVDSYTDATGHSYVTTATIPATCTEAGKMIFCCSDCEHERTVVTPAKGHKYEEHIVAPTCSEDGYTVYLCSVCDDYYIDDEVAALGHTMSEATCTAPATCSVCGATEGTALGHEAYTYSYASGTHSFKCTKCGETVTKAASDSKKFAINSAAPLLSDDIVMKYSTTVPAGFENAYMVFEFNGETFTFTEYEVNASNGRYEFKFPGINPQKMGDNICATLYATVDGVPVSVQIANYSLVKNCDNQLKKSTLDAKTRTMLSDVLMYGEKAQIVTNYKTDVLVTSLLSAASTLTPSTYPDALDSSLDMQKRTGTKDARVQFTGVTLSLGSKMAVRVAVTCTDTSLFTYKVTVSGREYTYTGADLVPVTDGSDGKYYLFFNQMKATEFGNKITFTCWEGDTQVSYTIEYSVYTFIYRNFTKVDANTQELLKAIYNYGESTK